MSKVTAIKAKPESTQCFTFKVTMLVQMLGDDAVKAQEALDSQGGYMTSRNVELVSTVEVFNGLEK